MDARLFRERIVPHLDGAYALARWLTRDAARAEDVVQESCERALRYFAGYDGGDARAWLFRIVRNTAYTNLRQRHPPHDPLDAAEHVAASDPDPEERFAASERAANVEDALMRLPPTLREVLVLCELEELSYREIARITEVPIGTVMSRLWRARQAMRTLLEAAP